MKSAAPPMRCRAAPVHRRVSRWRKARVRGRLLTHAHGIVAGVPAAVKTTLTELEGSRVRLRVEVPADELEGRVERKAHQLGRDLKLPGFRRGKVPPGLVIQRMGRDAVLEQAVRETLPRWYSDAVEAAGIVPIGDPEVKLDDLPPLGEPLAFSIAVGDSVAGADGRDQLIELGAGKLIPGFEEGLVGAGAGESRELELAFPDDYPSAELAGRLVRFGVTVKDVKRKELPPLDDDLAL